MNIHPTESILPESRPAKRRQKYMGFTLQPGDEELLDQLPPRQSEILRSQGKYTELAAKLGVAVGTIRSRLHRARAALVALRQHSAEERSTATLS